jgi:hypothetical protein
VGVKMEVILRAMAMRQSSKMQNQSEEAKASQRERRKSLQLSYMHKLNKGGKELAAKFTVACGVRETHDVFQAARIFRKQKTREFVNYLIFLAVFSFSTLQQRPVPQTHDFIFNAIDGSIMGNGYTSVAYFKTLEDMGSNEDFWGWITEVTPQYLYQDKWFNGTEFGPDFRGTKWRFLQNNLVVQRPRMRQIRVEREDCEVPRRMSSSSYGGLLANGSYEGTNFRSRDGLGDCYPPISTGTIDKSGHWGVVMVNGTVEKKPMPYRSAKELGTSGFNSRATASPQSYEGGGYLQEFPLGLNNAQYAAMLQGLKQYGWTDRQTRAVIFDTTIYNLELNTFLNLRIAFEFQPHGFVLSYLSERAMRMGYVRQSDHELLICPSLSHLPHSRGYLRTLCMYV